MVDIALEIDLVSEFRDVGIDIFDEVPVLKKLCELCTEHKLSAEEITAQWVSFGVRKRVMHDVSTDNLCDFEKRQLLKSKKTSTLEKKRIPVARNECTICFLPFDEDEHCPYLLACAHTFCSTCIQKLIDSAIAIVTCPVCDSPTPVPNGVADLKKNFMMVDAVRGDGDTADTLLRGDEDDVTTNLSDGSGEQPEVPCDVCEEKHEATYRCLDCEEYLCETFAKAHTRSRMSQKHSVVSLKELRNDPKLVTTASLCPQHGDRYCYFDEDCQKVVCRDCIILEHRGHVCTPLKEAATEARSTLAQSIDLASEHLSEMSEHERGIDVCRRDAKDAAEAKRQCIENEFGKVHRSLNIRKNMIIKTVQANCKKMVDDLAEKRIQLNFAKESLLKSIDEVNIERETSGDISILTNKGNLEARLHQAKPAVQPELKLAEELEIDASPILRAIASMGGVGQASTSDDATNEISKQSRKLVIPSFTSHPRRVRIPKRSFSSISEASGKRKCNAPLGTYDNPWYVASSDINGDAPSSRITTAYVRKSFAVGLSGEEYTGYRPVTLADLMSHAACYRLQRCYTLNTGLPLLEDPLECIGRLHVCDGWLSVNHAAVHAKGHVSHRRNTIGGRYVAVNAKTGAAWPPEVESLKRAKGGKSWYTTGRPLLFIKE